MKVKREFERDGKKIIKCQLNNLDKDVRSRECQNLCSDDICPNATCPLMKCVLPAYDICSGHKMCSKKILFKDFVLKHLF